MEQFEKVVKGLEFCVRNKSGVCSKECPYKILCFYTEGEKVKDRLTSDALALINAQQERINELEARQKWISVKDRLPERKWINCLVATKIQGCETRGFNIAWVNDDNGVWKSNDEWICDGREIVTHWRPLPDLPKEEEHESLERNRP